MLLIALCAFFLPNRCDVVRADEGAQVGPISLEDAIKTALERNQDALIAQQRVIEAQKALAEARAAFLPTVDAFAQYRRIDKSPSIEVPMFGQVSFGPTESYQAGFAGKQPLFTSGKLYNAYRMAEAGRRASEHEFDAVRNELIFRVQEAYYSILLTQEYVEVAEMSVKLLEAHLADVQRFLDSGLVARVDLLRTEVQKAVAEQRLNTARNAIDLAKSAFNNLLDRNLELPVVVEDVLRYEPKVVSLEETTARAIDQRPELKALQAAVEMALRNVRLAQSDYLPTIAAQGTYDWEKGTQLEIIGEDWHWTIGLSGSMPLWNWGATHARVVQARAKLEVAKLSLEKAKNGVALEVRQAFLKIGEAEKNVGVSEKAVASAQESYRTTKERYREGVGTNTDVLDAETALVGAQANRHQALYDYAVAVARLEKAIGTRSAK
jgi:TolC family type I secretion outer membrane protein